MQGYANGRGDGRETGSVSGIVHKEDLQERTRVSRGSRKRTLTRRPTSSEERTAMNATPSRGALRGGAQYRGFLVSSRAWSGNVREGYHCGVEGAVSSETERCCALDGLTRRGSPTHRRLTTCFLRTEPTSGSSETAPLGVAPKRAQSSCTTQSHSSMQAPRCSYSVIRSDALPSGSFRTATRWDESGEKDRWVIRLDEG